MIYHTLRQNAACYTSQLVLTLSGKINFQRFHTMWREFIYIHEILRAGIIAPRSHKPFLAILKEVPLPVQFLDISALNENEARKKIKDHSDNLRKQGISLDSIPLFAIALFKQKNNQYTMTFTYHHVILDGWSVSSLLQNVFQRLQKTFVSHHQ